MVPSSSLVVSVEPCEDGNLGLAALRLRDVFRFLRLQLLSLPRLVRIGSLGLRWLLC
jgi:hypothetical protein